ncbi:MAG: PIN domain-containing protein [bacterium]
MFFLDTNIIIRVLTRDDPLKAEYCFQLLKQAERKEITLVSSEAVFAETVFVLGSKKLYNLSADAIREALYPILSLPNLKIPHKKVLLRALDLFPSTNLDFEDTLAIAWMEELGINAIYSYDKGFDKIPTVTRLEP